MSAFTPYKKSSEKLKELLPADLRLKRNLLATGFVRFPIDLTSVLFTLPSYERNIFGTRYAMEMVRKTTNEDTIDKSEKFLIKNILKSDDKSEKQRTERRREDFEEQASKMETIVSNLGKSDSGHRCIYCGKIYSRKYGLKIHIRTHTGYKPLKCKYCLRPFGDPSNLNKHVRLHARGDTSYNCQFCGKVLVRRRDLERHVKSKHGEPSST